MMSKTFLLCLIGLVLWSAQAMALFEDKNMCDDMIENNVDKDKIRKCLESPDPDKGPSEYYKKEQKKKAEKDRKQAAKDANEEQEKSIKVAEKEKIKRNIELKEFTQSEIEEKTLMPIYAKKIEYDDGEVDGEKILTEGDALCGYLKYQRAISSKISSDITPSYANKKGMTIRKNSKPKTFATDDKDIDYVVRKYTSITCAKVIDPSIEGTEDAIDEMPTDLMVVESQKRSSDESINVNDDSRGSHKKESYSEGHSPGGAISPYVLKKDRQK